MDQELIIRLFKSLLLARAFEEKKIELAKEINAVDLGPCSCYGQEAIPVGFCFGLEKDDYVLPSIRSYLPADITKGVPLKAIAAEMFCRVGGSSNGRELSSKITFPERCVIGGTGVLGNNITVTAGIALAAKYKRTRQVAVCFMGDGTSNREEFYSGINVAALKNLPAIFVVETNLIAEFTPFKKFIPIENVADRAAAFGIPGKIVDGNDVIAVFETAQEAIQRARRGEGPTLVECKTCRVRPMSEMGDPKKGLPAELIEEWKKKDPVKRMKEHMLKIGALKEENIAQFEGECRGEVGEAIRFAKESRYPTPNEVLGEVYAEGVRIE